MVHVIIMILLAVLFPMQVYAIDFGGFNRDTQMEYLVPRAPDLPEVSPEDQLAEKILQEPPRAVTVENTGTNWWLWGGVGLAVAAGGVIALSGGGGKSGASGGGTAPTTVTGSW